MNPEQQRIAIAKVCGFKRGPSPTDIVEVWLNKHGYEVVNLPLYLESLDAMHVAEKFLQQGDQMTEYIMTLFKVCRRNESKPSDCICATAAQRAEAFLRTLNLWVDN